MWIEVNMVTSKYIRPWWQFASVASLKVSSFATWATWISINPEKRIEGTCLQRDIAALN
jgi:hypothetical protein